MSPESHTAVILLESLDFEIECDVSGISCGDDHRANATKLCLVEPRPGNGRQLVWTETNRRIWAPACDACFEGLHGLLAVIEWKPL